jgi:hypothetical protein
MERIAPCGCSEARQHLNRTGQGTETWNFMDGDKRVAVQFAGPIQGGQTGRLSPRLNRGTRVLTELLIEFFE